MPNNIFLSAQHHCHRFTKVLSDNSKAILYGGLLAVFLSWIIVTRVIRRRSVSPRRPNSPDPEKPASRPGSTFKAPERPPGVWTPVDFKRPKATPLLDWDVHKTEPLPYRPFKHGPYHITMGLRTMQWDDWIELDNHYLKYHADKARRILERGSKCCKTAPEAMDGAIELLEELYAQLPLPQNQTKPSSSNLAAPISPNATPPSSPKPPPASKTSPPQKPST